MALRHESVQAWTASFDFQNLVKGEIINIFNAAWHQPQRVRMPSAWWSCANC